MVRAPFFFHAEAQRSQKDRTLSMLIFAIRLVIINVD